MKFWHLCDTLGKSVCRVRDKMRRVKACVDDCDRASWQHDWR